MNYKCTNCDEEWPKSEGLQAHKCESSRSPGCSTALTDRERWLMMNAFGAGFNRAFGNMDDWLEVTMTDGETTIENTLCRQAPSR